MSSAFRRSPADRWLGLGPSTHRYDIDRRLRVPMTDGVELAATRYVPRGQARGPVILIRTPYGREGRLWSYLLPRPLAARGFQVVVQDVRGTFGSEGIFEPGRNERADGTATVEWLRQQPWCDGRVAMTGGSYLGTTQWAVGPYLEDPLSAMTVSIGSSTMMGSWYPQGALGLDQTLRWSFLIATQESRLGGLSLLVNKKRIARALASPDFANADVHALGAVSSIFRAGVEHADQQDYWVDALDYSAERGKLRTPTSMVTGWYDLFLRDQLKDHQALVAAGQESRITVGPFSHGSLELIPLQVRDALEFFDQTLRGTRRERTAPVRLFIQGVDLWRDFDAWPPPATPAKLTLGSEGTASFDSPAAPASTPTIVKTVSYYPADPTPAVGGPTLNMPAGRQNQKNVEARPDVLVHTSSALSDALQVIGTITAHLTVSTEDPSALVVVRLCDVDPAGASWNVAEGLAPLASSPEGAAVTIELDPTAYVFQPGHKLRVQIAAGAHPRVVDPRGGAYRVQITYSPDASPTLVLPVIHSDV
jgi:putative CocE/NonD family hydrolase